MPDPADETFAVPVSGPGDEGPSDEGPSEGPSEGASEAVRAVRERFPEPPRQGSLRKLEPGQGLALLAILACAWSPFILWFFFGPLAFILGALAYRKGEKRAKWILVAAVVCTIAGAIITTLPDKFVSN